MDPLAMQCKIKLETFRIKELKDVLSRIGAAKQGRKQVLVDKIMAAILLQEHQLNPIGLKLENGLSRYMIDREKIANVIDDIYRMRHSGAPDLATSIDDGKNASFSQLKLCELEHVKNHGDCKIRCPCGNSTTSGDMIQCEDPSCFVLQHVNCVTIPEKDGMKPQVSSSFFCEICRLNNGDPFCVSEAHLLLPTKITAVTKFPYGAEGSVMQSLEETFMLNHSQRELLRTPKYDIQVWCILIGDEVAFRMHWPLKAELRVNGDLVCTTNRPGLQKLGINGRDDGLVITDYVREGRNRISICACDGRSFCVGVRIISRLTVDEVFDRIPNEQEGEDFDMAVSRVRRSIVGCAGSGDDSDSDIEVVSEIVTVSLRCPMSGSRMNMAGRFKPCRHMGCFDLHTFLELNQRTHKWLCPICMKNYTLKDLIIDPFFNRISSVLKNYGDDVTEVEMKPDGSWRPKIEGDLNYECWRFPDGAISASKKLTDCSEFQEHSSNERVPLVKISKRICNNETNDNDLIFVEKTLQNHGRSHCSNDSIIYSDFSVNQQQIRPLNELSGRKNEVNSKPAEAPAVSWLSGSILHELYQPKSPEVIFLSDTDEDMLTDYDMELRAGPEQILNTDVNEKFGGGDFDVYVPAREADSLQRNMTVPLDFFGINTENSGNQLDAFWPGMPSTPFEVFTAVPDVEITARDYFSNEAMFPVTNEKVMANISTSYTNCYPELQNFISTKSADNLNQSVSADPSLRIFLPEQPARCDVEPHIPEPRIQKSTLFPEDSLQEWISLSLGGSGAFTILPPS